MSLALHKLRPWNDPDDHIKVAHLPQSIHSRKTFARLVRQHEFEVALQRLFEHHALCQRCAHIDRGDQNGPDRCSDRGDRDHASFVQGCGFDYLISYDHRSRVCCFDHVQNVLGFYLIWTHPAHDSSHRDGPYGLSSCDDDGRRGARDYLDDVCACHVRIFGFSGFSDLCLFWILQMR